jgi:hypothetical protein
MSLAKKIAARWLAGNQHYSAVTASMNIENVISRLQEIAKTNPGIPVVIWQTTGGGTVTEMIPESIDLQTGSNDNVQDATSENPRAVIYIG